MDILKCKISGKQMQITDTYLSQGSNWPIEYKFGLIGEWQKLNPYFERDVKRAQVFTWQIEDNQLGRNILNRFCLHPNVQITSLDLSFRGKLKIFQEITKAKWNVINLSIKQIDKEKMACIVVAEWPNMGQLALSFAKVNDAVLNMLWMSKWNKIEKIYLHQNEITCLGLEGMHLKNWSMLQFINLSDNCLGTKGIRYLTRIKAPKLNTLYLQRVMLNNEGVRQLSKGIFSNLLCLSLLHNPIDDRGTKYLTKSKWCHLFQLKISFPNLINDQIYYLCMAIFKIRHIYGINRSKHRTNRQLSILSLLTNKYPTIYAFR